MPQKLSETFAKLNEFPNSLQFLIFMCVEEYLLVIFLLKSREQSLLSMIIGSEGAFLLRLQWYLSNERPARYQSCEMWKVRKVQAAYLRVVFDTLSLVP